MQIENCFLCFRKKLISILNSDRSDHTWINYKVSSALKLHTIQVIHEKLTKRSLHEATCKVRRADSTLWQQLLRGLKPARNEKWSSIALIFFFLCESRNVISFVIFSAGLIYRQMNLTPYSEVLVFLLISFAGVSHANRFKRRHRKIDGLAKLKGWFPVFICREIVHCSC